MLTTPLHLRAQIFILRTPARRTLRLRLSEITFALVGPQGTSTQPVLRPQFPQASYNIMFQGLVEALMPYSDQSASEIQRPASPKPEVVEAVRSDLIARECAIQNALLDLMPLVK